MPIGISADITPGNYLNKKGISFSAMTIPDTYNEEMRIQFTNNNATSYNIHAGEKMAQVKFRKGIVSLCKLNTQQSPYLE
jgi:dUTPase